MNAPLLALLLLATLLAPAATAGPTGVECPDDCHVYVDGEEVLCLNVDQQWFLHEPLFCRPIL